MKKTILALATIFMLVSCGEKNNSDTKTIGTHNHEEAFSEPETVNETTGNILHVESTDQMQYTVNELRAAPGTITLTLKHIGKMEKTVMGHNLVILKPQTDIANFSLKAVDAKATDYIPESEKGNVIAHTKVIGGGESDTIEFTINEKGTYDFICSFPGHSSIMKGKLIIE